MRVAVINVLKSCQYQAVSLFHEGKKLGILLLPTNHNILERREFVANSQRFAERPLLESSS
jgi:hypothetical protein